STPTTFRSRRRKRRPGRPPPSRTIAEACARRSTCAPRWYPFRSACARCEGTGWRPVEQDGIRRVERCSCWQQTAATRALEAARVPPRYARCVLDSFILYPNERLQAAVARARRFVEAFPAVTKGLCLIGPPGIGKTHIAVSVLRAVILEKGARGLFYDVRDLLRIIRSTYNPVVRTAEMDVLRPVMEADLLVLDD